MRQRYACVRAHTHDTEADSAPLPLRSAATRGNTEGESNEL